MDLGLTTRDEPWGTLVYNRNADEFAAEVKKGKEPLPTAPIGIGWIIIGGCNLKCIHCYGNAEALPSTVLSTNDCMTIADKIIEAKVMRVVISGGEPLLRDDIFLVIRKLYENNISVVLGTNGSFIEETNAELLHMCTRVEISLDAATPELNNRIRPSRQRRGNAWHETMKALQVCLKHEVNLRVLTALNTWNQYQIVEMGEVLNNLGVRDWALSWTIPAGRALPVFNQLRPAEQIVEGNIKKAQELFPSLGIRYSHRTMLQFNRFYCLILPDGQIATEDMVAGQKLSFGSLLQQPIASAWNSENYNLTQHFEKWVGSRVHYV